MISKAMDRLLVHCKLLPSILLHCPNNSPVSNYILSRVERGTGKRKEYTTQCPWLGLQETIPPDLESSTLTIRAITHPTTKIIGTYHSTQLWESFTDKWKGLIINNMPVKNIELAVRHGILMYKTQHM